MARSKSEAAERILKLRQLIDKYRYEYHVLDTQEVSDAVNDSLKHELYQLEQAYPDLIVADSPTQRIGGKPLDKFNKIEHVYPMLSMEDVFSFAELGDWEARLLKIREGQSTDYYAMLKIDGLAVSIVYQDGLLVTAATRGDGKIGEEVTNNIKTIEAVPLALRAPDEAELQSLQATFGVSAEMIEKIRSRVGRIEIRGEVYMPKAAFEAMNQERAKKGEETFANPRNVSAGSIRQLDPAIAASRPLDYMAWRLETELGEMTQTLGVEILKLFGFKTSIGQQCENLKAVKAFFEAMGKKRDKLDFWIDGVVVRVNDNVAYKQLGVVGKTPRGLVAWKFPAEEATTVVESVDWFVGRTGALTPVATVAPTFVAGTTVTHASLHNADEIERLGLRVGDTVILTKAGDIIPKIMKVLTELRTGHEQPVMIPEQCPVCDAPTKRVEGEVALMCSNTSCYAKEREKVLYAARAFGIDGLGDRIVEKLLDAGLVKTPPDIFRLQAADFLGIEGFAELSAKKLYDQIQTRKDIELAPFIVSLGVRHVGAETAFALSLAFGTIDNIASASLDELERVPDVGVTVAQSIHEFFQSEHGKHMIKDFAEVGVMIKQAKAIKRVLDGQRFVVTGTLESIGREEAKDKIRLLGGNVSESVSKKTDFVVVGENPGSKADKAQELGVKILSEAEFLRMLA
ncbi:MAG: NAD-dependent DNA ligase LigA [Patescibacteria group bacterium]